MKALVLNGPLDLELSDLPAPGAPEPGQVRVKVKAVGVCGSDVHYYEHGRIGDFVVEEPMVLGHEAAGVVEAVGDGVRSLSPGDAVAMEPGVPCGDCRECRIGRYNLCKDVRFWATPPIDGVLAEFALHPAAMTYKLPAGMTLDEGALMEPLAVGVHACNRGGVGPGCVVAVNGAGPIGCVTLMAALAFGASQVVVADVVPDRLERARELGAETVVDARSESLASAVMSATGGRGADVGIECSGHPSGPQTLVDAAAPGGRVVLVGMGPQPTDLDLVAAMVKEVDLATVFRYAHNYPTAIDLTASGRIPVARLVTDRFPLEDSVAAFEFASAGRPGTCKVMIDV
ncbi:MAG: NAD(P)-dependent alcohol dehydrogenase [Chloroflexi bacterium]|nr:NAD(P)-dependent alcohol dehydrogenase [Chloroflexota bacterium]MXY00739.1 NAD(P)-dependent alcohol dehydrogenase [Chloroflexota bacterium]MXY13808.1 NAD(P)-dependent alcohol dehydrogenase [Chloroflexota bacterium]